MSSLNSKLAAFKKEQADTAARNIQHSRPANTHTPARVSTPQPSGDASKKRSHEVASAPPPPSIQSMGSAGHELLTHVSYARTHLKSKSPQSLTFSEIIRHLSLPNDSGRKIPLIQQALETDDHVEVLPRGTNGSKEISFKYKPKHPVTNAEELKDYLARQPTAAGIQVKELKDGWTDCIKAIDQLEKEHSVLVLRGKKDNAPKIVWADFPAYHLPVDADFRTFWMQTKPPGEGEIRAELEKGGITPTSHVKEVRKHDMRKKERKRASRRGGKTTNTHMQGILKDYSRK